MCTLHVGLMTPYQIIYHYVCHCHGMVSSWQCEAFELLCDFKHPLSPPLCSLIVMDYDEFSHDDFIGGTRVKLYDVLYSQTYKINIRRLLDDNIVSLIISGEFPAIMVDLKWVQVLTGSGKVVSLTKNATHRTKKCQAYRAI